MERLDKEWPDRRDQDRVFEEPGVQEDKGAIAMGSSQLSAAAEDAGGDLPDRLWAVIITVKNYEDEYILSEQ